MNVTRLKKGCLLIAAVLMVYAFLPAACAAAESGEIPVTEQTFPDPAFRGWVLDEKNLDGAGSDGILTEEEIAGITEISFSADSNARAGSLAGIEYFTSLKNLSVSGHRLDELDLSENEELEFVFCKSNDLRVLNVTNSPELRTLNCEQNKLSSLDLSGNPELKALHVSNNLLQTLDFRNNPKLELVEVFDNRLTNLDVSGLSGLKFLSAGDNRLTSLDLRANRMLEGSGFSASYNNLRQIYLPDLAGRMLSADSFFRQNPVKGYDNVQWYRDDAYQNPIDQNGIPADGQTIYAKRIANSYTVKFSANGGSGTMSPQKAQYGERFTLSGSRFSKRGYTFAGWDTWKDGSGISYGDKASVENLGGTYQGETISLYAQWEPVRYRIRYEKNSEDAEGDAMGETRAVYGKDAALLPSTFERERYHFAGWALKPDGAAVYADQASVWNLTAQEDGTVTLYAAWELKPEEARKPYLEQMDLAFADYKNEDYTAEDWASLESLYEKGREAIIGMGSDSAAMKASLSRTISAAEKIKTERQRIRELTEGWSAQHQEALNWMEVSLSDAVQAESAEEKTGEALQSLDRLDKYSTLKTPELRGKLSEQARKQLRPQAEELENTHVAARWLAGTENAHKLPLKQVTPAMKNRLKGLSDGYERLTEVQQAHIGADVAEALFLRLETAEAAEPETDPGKTEAPSEILSTENTSGRQETAGRNTANRAVKPKTPVLRVKAGKKKAVLSWSKVSGAEGYDIYQASRKNGKFKKIKTLKGGKTSYAKKHRKKGGTYYCKVRAWKMEGGKKLVSTYSKVKSVKVK